MVIMLKLVWVMAICPAGVAGRTPLRKLPKDPGSTREPSITLAMGKRINRVVKIRVPMMLNIRWMMVARLALRVVPMEARTAVMQVPMFWPNRTNTELA